MDRNELLKQCENAIIHKDNWIRGDDTVVALRKIGLAMALLKSECDFSIRPTEIGFHFIIVDFRYKSTAYIDDVDLFTTIIIPTQDIIDKSYNKNWLMKSRHVSWNNCHSGKIVMKELPNG